MPRRGSTKTQGNKGPTQVTSSTAASTFPATSTASPGHNASPGETILSVQNLQKTYGLRRGSQTKALAGVSFDVHKGEMVAIMGPSGSGKTTLLNCIATIDSPSAGEIYLAGENIANMKASQVADFRRKQLGFIFQDANLLDTLTCQENIALPLCISHEKSRDIAQRVHDLQKELSILDIAKKYPYQVSGGQAQRAAAARAISTNPSLVLADEPTGALDSKNSKVLLECFEALNALRGATILMVTHDAFAASYFKRVLFIRDGEIFSELYRGELTRQAFLESITNVVAVIGGQNVR